MWSSLIAFALTLAGSPGIQETRTWTDASGHYQFDAELIAYSDTQAVFKKSSGELVAMALADLSEADREFLKAKAASEASGGSAEDLRTWTMEGGVKVAGRIVEFAERDVTIQRTRGKIYVNDKPFDNLPEVYQAMIPRIVGHFEKNGVDDRRGLESWLNRQGLQPRTFHCEGVLLELENGDRYAVPFFFFSTNDAKILRPGWERWKAAHDDAAKQEEQSFYLRSQAEAYDQELKQMREIAQLQLQVQAYDAGLFDLWEVMLYPPNGSYGMATSVVLPGRNSQEAASAAVQKYPGYSVGPIAKVRRRR
jgi:hypothetical protein